jgi:hypothetical protein
MAFSQMHDLMPGLVQGMEQVRASGQLPDLAWQSAAGGAQSRVLVMAARSQGMPHGLDAHNERCTVAMMKWARQSFGTPETLSVVASSPERLASLITGKGLHMFNCAKLSQLVCSPMPKGDRAAHFLPWATGRFARVQLGVDT